MLRMHEKLLVYRLWLWEWYFVMIAMFWSEGASFSSTLYATWWLAVVQQEENAAKVTYLLSLGGITNSACLAKYPNASAS